MLFLIINLFCCINRIPCSNPIISCRSCGYIYPAAVPHIVMGTVLEVGKLGPPYGLIGIGVGRSGG